MYEDDAPANSWKRILLGYGGSPGVPAIDTTIIDANGCAPVIMTEDYSNKVKTVYASSWPFYVIYSLLNTAKKLQEIIVEKTEKIKLGVITWRAEEGPPATNDPLEKRLDKEAVEVVEDLTFVIFNKIDTNLESAKKASKEHNKTKLSDGDDLNMTLMSNAISDALDDILRERNDKLEGALFEAEKMITKGYAHIDNLLDVSCNATLKDETLLLKLRNHERREIRLAAQKVFEKIRPTKAEKLARRIYDWIDCAKSWLNIHNINKKQKDV